MVNFGTSAAASIPPSANEVVLEAAAAERLESRRLRIRELREAIEGGEYRVSAGDLADAILRAARHSN